MRTAAWGLIGAVALLACGGPAPGNGAPVTNQQLAEEEADEAEYGSPEALAAKRQACHFGAGASVAETLGLDDEARAVLPIRHVIVLMKENRSFDLILGRLHESGQPASERIPAGFTNPDTSGAAVGPFHLPTTCVAHDPAHQWGSMHRQIDGENMDGFVKSAAASTGTDGHFVMGNYDAHDLPFYYWMANTFAVDDRHFASERSGTYPNRLFMLLGTADGVTATGKGYPSPSTRTIFDSLDAARVTWGVYSDGSLLGGALPWARTHVGAHSYGSFLAALDDGSLPEVAFVDGIDDVEDEHPVGDVQVGEQWTRGIYEHAIASDLWPELAIVWTYDEAGGFADHVPPPQHACVARPVPRDAAFDEPGTRVPFAVVSPWAKPHYVSHVVHEHAAITRFIEAVFGLGALTARDANSDALLDLFDFTHPALLEPPAAPAGGELGCLRRVGARDGTRP